MSKYKKIAGLLILCIGTCCISGCDYSVHGDATEGLFSEDVEEPINPHGEKFTYIDSSRTVEDGIVTITFRYKIEEDD